MSIRLPIPGLPGTTTVIRVAGASMLVAVPLVASLVLRPEQILVEHIVFEGANHASSAQLRHLADLPNGTPVWAVDAAEVGAAVERHPWVRDATAVVRWPDRVVVTVQEFQPVALLHADQLLYVDGAGTPFLPALPGDLDYPHLTGIAALDEVHPDLAPLAIRDGLWLLDEVDSRGLVSRSSVSEVAFSRTRGWTLHVGPARIVFGPSGLARQVDRLAALLDGGLDLETPTLVDLAPTSVAIVRPISPPSGG